VPGRKKRNQNREETILKRSARWETSTQCRAARLKHPRKAEKRGVLLATARKRRESKGKGKISSDALRGKGSLVLRGGINKEERSRLEPSEDHLSRMKEVRSFPSGGALAGKKEFCE